jgi:choline dehydrogenase-like flavoprotein
LKTLPTEKVDAIVVGSGAAGSAFAAKLAAGGKTVHILEAGPQRQQSDLVSSTLWSRRLKWHAAPVLEDGANPVGHVFNAGSGTGGSAMHHFAVWPRMHPDDFNMRSEFDRGLDWPIRYADLEPYYDQVQSEAGISGDASLEKWRPSGAPYPMPPVPVFEQGHILAKGFEKLGMHVAPLPLAITSRDFAGRPACLWDGWCEAGCPIGALANPLTVHLPIAFANGARISHDTTVTKLLLDQTGKRVIGVEALASDGSRQTLYSDVVVLAAFAVQNPRLLLASASTQHPDGIGNNNGLLGRYVMTHSAGLIYGLFDENTRHYMGAFGGQLVNQDRYAKQSHKSDGAFGSYQWMIAQAVKPTDLLGIATTRGDLIGAELHTFMQRAARGFASMTAVVEGLPVADNRVTLADEADSHGVPLAKVTHSTHADSTALWRATLAEGRSIFEAAGASEVWTGPQGSMHIMGGTIMGKSAADSVTNSYGQLHDVANLVIAGPGLFPTSAGVNPTFTVHALVARSAQHLLQQWDSEFA